MARYTSARGEQVDFDLLHLQNKEVIAIGNANMNASGDKLGPGGKIIRNVEDIPETQMADPNAAYNEINPKSTKMVSLKGSVDDLPAPTPRAKEIEQKAKIEEIAKEIEIKPTKVEEKPKNKRKIIDSEE